MSRSPLPSQGIRLDDPVSSTSSQTPQTQTKTGTTTTNSRTLNPAHESFVIVQTEEDEGQTPDPFHPKPHDADFTFVGGVYPSLAVANTAALTLAAQKCNCNIPSLTFPPTPPSTASRHTTTASPPPLTHTTAITTSHSSASDPGSSPSLGPIADERARPQPTQHRSGDGRYSCRCTASSEGGGGAKGFVFEVRKIEVRPLGSRMGWSFSDDGGA